MVVVTPGYVFTKENFRFSLKVIFTYALTEPEGLEPETKRSPIQILEAGHTNLMSFTVSVENFS